MRGPRRLAYTSNLLYTTSVEAGSRTSGGSVAACASLGSGITAGLRLAKHRFEEAGIR